MLAAWPKERRIFFCDEGGDAKPLGASRARHGRPAAILTGPEGGFDPAEREALRALAFVTPVTLGPRILRADTAALAALAIWQSVKGDFAPASVALFVAVPRSRATHPRRRGGTLPSALYCRMARWVCQPPETFTA